MRRSDGVRLGSLEVKRVLGKDESPGSNPGLGSFCERYIAEFQLRDFGVNPTGPNQPPSGTPPNTKIARSQYIT